MKHCITEKEWAALEAVLMAAEIPYNVSWDSHASEDDPNVVYDKYIRIDPVVIQHVRTKEAK